MTAGASDGATTLDSASVLDNVVWHSLVGHHAAIAEVVGTARRYPGDVSPFYGVDGWDDPERTWHDLAALTGPDGHLVLFRVGVPETPPGWHEVMRGTGYQMVVDEITGTVEVPIRELTHEDVPQMLHLTHTTKPGPFLNRTNEMGRYFGTFDGDELVAMAGERMHPAGWTEISAVCTAERARGRGLAAALTKHVADVIRERGERPFLHVAGHNESAKRVYERIGFTVRTMTDFVVLRPPDV